MKFQKAMLDLRELLEDARDDYKKGYVYLAGQAIEKALELLRIAETNTPVSLYLFPSVPFVPIQREPVTIYGCVPTVMYGCNPVDTSDGTVTSFTITDSDGNGNWYNLLGEKINDD